MNDPDDVIFLESWKFRAIQGVPIAIIALLPMSLIRDMSGFRYVSFASIIALFYTGIVLLVELPDYAKKNYSETRC
jgi:MFS-type transporter involved in bile tolerance (Atg22 family)